MRIRNCVLLYLLASSIGYAGTVSSLIDYQLYKDFAMNRGKFKVGATNVVVDRKDGTSMTINVPIPDFASTDSIGVGTLIDPSYVGGVKHNGGYQDVTYGYKTGHTYDIIDRNENPKRDYHTPRLRKVVTDVAPTVCNTDDNLLQDWQHKYLAYARVGSGHQYIQHPDGKKDDLSYAYHYLTGGFVPPELFYKDKGIWVGDRNGAFPKDVKLSPLPIYIEPGDSGSPLWGFNKQTQKWELVAFAMAIGNSEISIYIPVNNEFLNGVIKADTLPDVKDIASNGEIVWNGITGEGNTGSGTIVQGDNTWTYNGLKTTLDLNKASDADMNSTKHLTFAGEGGKIKLADSINMGAGKLTFKNNYTVYGETGKETWVGAGIQIDKDKNVLWQVNGVAGDALHKIGEGTLHVNATGVNHGALNVGDGTVILDQQADESGNKQAFEYIDIVSGRATVVLNDANQVDTSKINFLFRGGRLDVNSNNITFGDIKAVDRGAMIVNHSDKKATVDINGEKFKKKASIYHGQFGENDESKNNGALDININGKEGNTFAIAGGSTLNGDFNVNGMGTNLIMSGDRDLHAEEDIKNTTINGDYLYSNFKYNNINLAQGTNFYGSVYSSMNGNIQTNGNNNLVMGYVSGKSKFVYDETQDTKEQNAVEIVLNDENTKGEFNKITTFYNGNINLKSSNLDMGYTQFVGELALDKTSNINSSNSEIYAKIDGKEGKLTLDNTKLNITGDSIIGNLNANNSTIGFDSPNRANNYSTLEINEYSGNSNMVFNVNSQSGDSDKVIINNLGNDTSSINVKIDDSALKPNYGTKLTLVDIKSTEGKKLTLGNGETTQVIDIGPVMTQIGSTTNGEVGKIDYVIPQLTNKTAGSTTRTMLAEYAARMELVRSQNILLNESFDAMNPEDFKGGISLRGNFSDSKYESSKFSKFKQNIGNYGVSYENESMVNPEWNMYKGVAFTYGHSNVEYSGNYSGNMNAYTGHIYGKLMRNDGLFVKGSLGYSYIDEDINSDNFDTGVVSFGTGIGYALDFDGLKFTTTLDGNLYYLPGVNYTLHFGNKSQEANVDAEYILAITPKVKVEKAIYFNNFKIKPFGAISYEFDKYLKNDSPEITTTDVGLYTGLVERGTVLETGANVEYSNITVGAEAKYFTGKESAEKLMGTVNLKYTF